MACNSVAAQVLSALADMEILLKNIFLDSSILIKKSLKREMPKT